MTNFCQACGGQRGLHFSTLPGCTCVNPPPINYVINQQIKREWRGLTKEEIAQGPQEVLPALYGRWGWAEKEAFEAVVAWAEAKLKEKNGG